MASTPFTITTLASLGLTALPTSRYLNTPVYSGASLTFLAQKIYNLIPLDSTDLRVTVQSGEEYRLDLLAQRLYQTPDLWWVLALMNGIRNPFMSPQAGQQLRAATAVRVYQSILGKV